MNQGGGLLLDTADSLLRLLRRLGGPASGFDNVILPPSGQVVARLFTDGARRPAAAGAQAADYFKGGLGHSGTVRPESK